MSLLVKETVSAAGSQFLRPLRLLFVCAPCVDCRGLFKNPLVKVRPGAKNHLKRTRKNGHSIYIVSRKHEPRRCMVDKELGRGKAVLGGEQKVYICLCLCFVCVRIGSTIVW